MKTLSMEALVRKKGLRGPDLFLSGSDLIKIWWDLLRSYKNPNIMVNPQVVNEPILFLTK